MNESEQALGWLQDWYVAQCNDDWEHDWGVKIATLDNPGWTVTIDLEEQTYPRQDVNRSTHDWVWAWSSEKIFNARCGPGNLAEALTLFRTLATSNTP